MLVIPANVVGRPLLIIDAKPSTRRHYAANESTRRHSAANNSTRRHSAANKLARRPPAAKGLAGRLSLAPHTRRAYVSAMAISIISPFQTPLRFHPFAIFLRLGGGWIMSFESILYKKSYAASHPTEDLRQPDFFVDLNLDQLVSAILKGKEEYNLSPFYHQPLTEVENVIYRQQVMADCKDNAIMTAITVFAARMHAVWDILKKTEKLYYHYNKLHWFIESVRLYCELIRTFSLDLDKCTLTSSGLRSFKDYLGKYIASDTFHSLETESQRMATSLSSVVYTLQIKDNAVRVRTFSSESDYSEEVLAVFEKFKQKEEMGKLPIKDSDQNMNHVEAAILECVAKLFPDIFSALDAFHEKYARFIDETVKIFEREIQFYVSYTQFIAKLSAMGLRFCLPQIAGEHKDISCSGGFDIVLAHKLISENQKIVCNDYLLDGEERIVVVTGPNQGGKTTFARMFGQINYLGALGCPVPARDASIFLFDHIFTHFERQENIINLRGKLQDDLIRINDILQQTTSSTLVIMNEIFTSTTSHDAIYLGTKILQSIIKLKAICVCVTFIDELSALSDNIVSMMSLVDDNNQAERSYKVCRKMADGLAYSQKIVEKYNLTYQKLIDRIPL
ncbi:DNA mismatch repair protein MutS [Acerihabitans sp. KWT182]|uniref:DNA mismatch repair protein MutS n=1 Tax=Acerihabitans sp. KWT182 TaxID=3157919 RepID=A0AAU7QGQ8_9GAMM